MTQPGQFTLQDRPYYKPRKNVVLKNKPRYCLSIIFAIIGSALTIGGIVFLVVVTQPIVVAIALISFGLFIGLLFQLFACRFAIIYTLELDFENDKFIMDAGGNCCSTACSNVRRRDELPLEDLFGLFVAGWKTMVTPKIRSDAYDANGDYHPIPDLPKKPTYLVRAITQMGLSYCPNYYFPLNQVQEIYDAWNEYQGWAVQNGKRSANIQPPPGTNAYGQPVPIPRHTYQQQLQQQQQLYPQQQYVQQQTNQQAYVQPPAQQGLYQPEYSVQNGSYPPPDTLPGGNTHYFPAEQAADPGISDEKRVS
ncbi:hypothetical protein BLNAU_14998 [Blattamonas nauphoetae]|uniref:Uncharacterized protein n=1 Tax=Blattamonas nauphoetae TaxID=2049346 RepID=A0ABQ9XC33_9EUKA|nr:hypothetical protein BLNAU_14998 [Blattamonas nauphoetae]